MSDKERPSGSPADDPQPVQTDAVAPAADEKEEDPLVRRQKMFEALKKKRLEAKEANRKELEKEEKRMATDPKLLNKLERKHAVASDKLLKVDDPDFERKRAWDYTAEESEMWDKRMAKKSKHRDNVAFSDYQAEANKNYKRQVKRNEARLADLKAEYEEEEAARIERDLAAGYLREEVDEKTGKITYVDISGGMRDIQHELESTSRYPKPHQIDRVIADSEKGKSKRIKEREAQLSKGDDGDVTYINEGNKRYNERVQRSYGRFTTEIRKAMERGTNI